MAALKAIPQEHDGILYRSRTEARWAEFLDIADIPFEYEPEGYQLGDLWYVPDFLLSQALPDAVFLEVKGSGPSEAERQKASLLAFHSGKPVIVACGNPGQFVDLLWFERQEQPRACFIVEEHDQPGAWVAEFADGGGWAFPLCAGLVNCAAYGYQHPLLNEAGRLQFGAPNTAPTEEQISVAEWELLRKQVWPIMKSAWEKMKRGENS